MSSLKIGLVTSSGDESLQLEALLKERGVELLYTILPEEISEKHVANKDISVWLLNVDDDCWHDAVDHLLDESEVPVYFNEPGTLARQSHPDYWCSNLLDRLYDITGLKKDVPVEQAAPSVFINKSIEEKRKVTSDEPADNELPEQNTKESLSHSVEELTESLDMLELSSVNLPTDVAAELVAELESISPVLQQESKPANDANDELLEPVRSNENKENSSQEVAIDFGPEVQNEHTEQVSVQSETLELEGLDFEETELEEQSSEEEPNPIVNSPAVEAEADSLDIELKGWELEELTLEDLDSESFTSFNDAASQNESTQIESSQAESGQAESGQAESARKFLAAQSPDAAHESAPIEQEIGLSLQPMEDKSESGSEQLKSDSHTKESDLDGMNLEEFDLDISADTIAEELPKQEFPGSLDNEAPGLTLQLEEIAEQQEPPIVGRAQYQIDDPQLSEDASDAGEIGDADNDEQTEAATEETSANEQAQLAELSLEPIGETQSLEGKANFLDDSFEETAVEISVKDDDQSSADENLKADEPEIENLPETELTLEAIESDTAHKEPDWITQRENEDIISLDGTDETPESLSQSDDKDETESIVSDAPSLFELEETSLSQESPQSEEVGESLEPLIDQAADSLDENFSNAPSLSESEMKLNEDDKAELLAEITLEPVEDSLPPVSHLSGVTSDSSEIEIPMLEDTAVNVDFDEQPTVSKLALTPCWVIGASLGGPAAVKRFLQCIPADINASFIIAQHIDENFLPVLAEILSNSSEFEVNIANGSNNMRAGCLFIAPLKGKVVFLQDGSMLVDHSQKWSEPYSPCIDDVVESVSHAYGDLSGAILFSGMGQDGLSGARKMRERGGQVWAQSPESCANASMPQALIDNNQADFVGSPEQLASKLVAHLSTQKKIVAL